MDRRTFLMSLASAFCGGLPARSVDAQGATKVCDRLADRASRRRAWCLYVDAMRDALAELGYVEGRNLVIEFRYGDDVIGARAATGRRVGNGFPSI